MYSSSSFLHFNRRRFFEFSTYSTLEVCNNSIFTRNKLKKTKFLITSCLQLRERAFKLYSRKKSFLCLIQCELKVIKDTKLMKTTVEGNKEISYQKRHLQKRSDLLKLPYVKHPPSLMFGYSIELTLTLHH